jgi:hypothetical protein
MKKLMLALVLSLVLVTACPTDKAKAASVPPNAKLANATTALAPSQRDINIAFLAVILGSIMVGYEKAMRRQRIISVRKRRVRLDREDW